jgi:MFS family permease
MRGERWLALLLGTTVLAQGVVFAGRPVTTYRALELGASTAQVGVVVACFAVVPLLVAVPAGRAVDGEHAVAFLRWGAVLSLAGAVLLTLAPTLVVLGAANAVAGVGLLLSAISAQGIIARRSPLAGHDRAFGLFTVAASVGQLVGPVVSGAASSVGGGPRAGLLATSGLAVLLVASCVAYRGRLDLTPPAASGDDDEPHRPAEVGLVGILRTRGMPPAMLTSLAVLTSVDLLTAFLPVLAEERGLSPLTVGWLLALRALASIGSRLVVARLARRHGRAAVLLGSAGVSALALGLLPLPVGVPGLVALMLLAGFALGLGQPLTMSWVAAIAPSRGRATALAVRLGANRAGQVAVPAAAGALAGVSGTAGVFALGAALLGAAGAGVLVSRPPDAS